MKFFNRKPKTHGTVVFCMKSGTCIVADEVNIEKVEFRYTGAEITEITGFSQKVTAERRLLIQSITLSQIEAIVVRQYD